MHAAEFKTLREAIGLSISTLVKVIDVDERSIRKWESGKKTVPQDVVAQVQAIDAMINATAQDLFIECQQAGQPSVVLCRYIEEEELYEACPQFDGLPMSSYGVMLYRLKQKLTEAGIDATIEYPE